MTTDIQPNLTEGQQVTVSDPGLADLYALGAETYIALVGRNSMAGKVLIMTVDPSEPPGWKRLLSTTWYDPLDITVVPNFE